jgi:DNA topoisomerase VI subunit B
VVPPPSQPLAEELAKKQQNISVAEFFERNKQILGFDSPTRALLTAVKEAVDNALDACEEASVLPDIRVEINQGAHDNEYILVVEDNGPGIVKKQIANIFGSLLYGSRFHAVRQARGQQGIGISSTVLYGQLTTGKHAVVTSKIGKGHPAVKVELAIDTKKNAPEIIKTETESWEKESGTRIEIPLTGRYIKGKQSHWEYMRATAIVNPSSPIGRSTCSSAATTGFRPNPRRSSRIRREPRWERSFGWPGSSRATSSRRS